MLRSSSLLGRSIGALACAVAAVSCLVDAHATIIGEDDRRLIRDLAPQHRYRFIASPIGILATRKHGGTGSCTAAVIAPALILTAAYCADPSVSIPFSRMGPGLDLGRPQGFNDLGVPEGTLILGSSDPGARQDFKVNLNPVEINAELGYAVLSVEGNPSDTFGMVALSLRSPKESEKLFIIQMTPESIHSGLAVADGCAIQPAPIESHLLSYDCDTAPGAGGALIFSSADASVIGLHGLGSRGLVNHGVSMQDVWLASDLIRKNSFARFEAPPPPTDSEVPPGLPQKGFTLALASDLPPAIKLNSVVLINGREHVVASRADRQITFLGDDSSLANGLNLLALKEQFSSETGSWKFWNENHVLKAFEEPYKKSYAILVAIDDYDREKDPKQRGKTGYPKLTGMATHAELLKGALVKTGFPAENVLTLYDEQATLRNITSTLQEFWHGGKYADADRLFFYFGGHGDELSGSGFLVTYDIDTKRPTATGFLMADFVDRNFQNINPLHVLVALDACASGLSIPGTLDGETEDELKRFRALSIVRNDVEEKGRLLLVAGTDDQKALWENGGLFTHTLIKGLGGEGDMNRDGLIQFEELGLYVGNTVSSEAAMLRVKQQPRHFHATHFGRGKMLFLLPRAE